MSRRIVNKNTTRLTVPPEMFTSDFVNLPISVARKCALGTIVISNIAGNESLYILNELGQVVQVGSSSNAIVGGEVMDAINNVVIPELKEYVDNEVDEKIGQAITEYNETVIASANTLYNDIKNYVDGKIEIVEGEIETTDNRIDTEKEYLLGVISGLTAEIESLRQYVNNLKFSDHVLIKENAYMALENDGHAYINENGDLLVEGDYGYGDERYYIEWNPDVYYCIPEEGYGPTPDTGDTIVEISGNTLIVDFDVEDDHTFVLGDYAEISGTTIVIGTITPSNPEDVVVYPEDHLLEALSSIYIDEDNNAVVLPDNFVINEENNELII